jgi:hypothetical protein
MEQPQAMNFTNLMVRSNKPGTFQSQTMSALEFGTTGCTHLRVLPGQFYIEVSAIHRDGSVMKTALFNRDDVAEIYGERCR